MEYFEFNGLLHPNHHGFRNNCNTTTALLQMYDMWIEAMDRGELTGVVFLDQSAAFDMVNFEILLNKLSVYGFDEKSCSWFKSYLSERSQSVCVDGTCSPLLPIKSGVPQGSILGPLLYIIYTNELPESICKHQNNEYLSTFEIRCQNCGSICCFADDSSYSFSSKDDKEISDMISCKFQSISEFMASHELKLNTSKTHLLLLASDRLRRIRPNLNIGLNTGNEMIEISTSENLLGGIISQNLKFSDHIQNHENSLLRSLNSRLTALKSVCYLTDFATRKMIANGIFISKLVYLIPLWVGSENYLINSLQIIQNKAARAVTKCDRETPIPYLLHQCGWLSVAQLGMYHSLVMAYKVKNSHCPQYLFSKLWDTEKLPYNVRSTTECRIRLGRASQAVTEMARRSFKYRTTQDWNRLPADIRCANKLETFKVMVKDWIRKNINI